MYKFDRCCITYSSDPVEFGEWLLLYYAQHQSLYFMWMEMSVSIKIPWVRTVTSRYPSSYDFWCGQQVKLQQRQTIVLLDLLIMIYPLDNLTVIYHSTFWYIFDLICIYISISRTGVTISPLSNTIQRKFIYLLCHTWPRDSLWQ